MSLSTITQGEGKLFGLLGANAVAAGVKQGSDALHKAISNVMPLISDLVILTQWAVGLATLVYIICKIVKIRKSK